MPKMNEEQQRLAADNLRLVGYVLAQMKLPRNGDAYGAGCVGLCRAAAEWKKERGRFSVFAYTAIRNEVLDSLRTEMRYWNVKRRTVGPVFTEYGAQPEDGFGRLEEKEEAAVAAARLMEIVRGMNPRCRAVAELLCTGVSMSGAAREMGLSKQRLSQIVKKIRRAAI